MIQLTILHSGMILSIITIGIITILLIIILNMNQLNGEF